MASTRLTVSMREEIARRIVAHTFDEKINQFELRRKNFAPICYNHLYDYDKMQKKMNELPDGWLAESNYINVYTNYGTFTFYFEDKDKKPLKKRFLNSTGHTLRLDYNKPEDIKLSDIISDWQQEKRSCEKEKQKAYRDAMAVLNSVTTVSRAIEVWPEAEVFISKHQLYDKSNLPAINMTQLNAKLRLPPGDKQGKNSTTAVGN